jgi:hypothetical protein
MPTQFAILGAGIAIAIGLLAAALFGRYDIVSHGSQPILIFRVDRLTGEVEACMAHPASASESEGVKAQPAWCKASVKGL